MIHQALIRSVILDKRRAPGRQADPAGEERLVDGKRRVNRGSPAVDERGAWKRQVDQAGPLEICRHLVGDPPSVAGLLGADGAGSPLRRSARNFAVDIHRRGFHEPAPPIPEMQFARAVHVGVA